MEEKLTFNKLRATLNFQKSIIDLAKSENTKLVYGFNKNLKNQQKIAADLDEELADKRIDLCLTDSNGAILFDNDKNYKYSKEGLKELNAFVKEINEKELIFDFFKVNFADLSEAEKATFLDLETNTFSFNIEEDEKEALNYIISNFPEHLK